MFALFGGLAMLVAMVGIYGVTPTPSRAARARSACAWRLAPGPRVVLGLILAREPPDHARRRGGGWLLGLGVGQIMASMFVDLAAFDPGRSRWSPWVSSPPRWPRHGCRRAARRW